MISNDPADTIHLDYFVSPFADMGIDGAEAGADGAEVTGVAEAALLCGAGSGLLAGTACEGGCACVPEAVFFFPER